MSQEITLFGLIVALDMEGGMQGLGNGCVLTWLCMYLTLSRVMAREDSLRVL